MAKKKNRKSSRKQWEKMCALYGMPAAPKPRKSVLRRLGFRGWLGSPQAEQFIFGALLGGGAAYVLGDEEKRERVMQSAVRLYTGVLASVEEFREQLADIQAEVVAEQVGQAPLQ
ncbi:MAG: hypothetical protein IJR28_05895 [Ottowia sp.]|nr:hypothetical protein [Ottowia sp.]